MYGSSEQMGMLWCEVIFPQGLLERCEMGCGTCRNNGLELAPLLERHVDRSPFHTPLFTAIVHKYPTILPRLLDPSDGLLLTPALSAEHLLLTSGVGQELAGADPSMQQVVPSGQPAVPDGQHLLPNGQLPVPSGQHNVPSVQLPVPNGQPPLPSGQPAVPNGQEVMPCGPHPLPGRQQVEPSGQLPVPSGQPDVPSGQHSLPTVGQPAGREFVREPRPGQTESLSLLMAAASVGNIDAVDVLLSQAGTGSAEVAVHSVYGYSVTAQRMLRLYSTVWQSEKDWSAEQMRKVV